MLLLLRSSKLNLWSLNFLYFGFRSLQRPSSDPAKILAESLKIYFTLFLLIIDCDITPPLSSVNSSRIILKSYLRNRCSLMTARSYFAPLCA